MCSRSPAVATRSCSAPMPAACIGCRRTGACSASRPATARSMRCSTARFLAWRSIAPGCCGSAPSRAWSATTAPAPAPIGCPVAMARSSGCRRWSRCPTGSGSASTWTCTGSVTTGVGSVPIGPAHCRAGCCAWPRTAAAVTGWATARACGTSRPTVRCATSAKARRRCPAPTWWRACCATRKAGYGCRCRLAAWATCVRTGGGWRCWGRRTAWRRTCTRAWRRPAMAGHG